MLRFHPMSRQCCTRFERAARQLGWMRIAGLDEAGRGALFGPVTAAAVILNPKRRRKPHPYDSYREAWHYLYEPDGLEFA